MKKIITLLIVITLAVGLTFIGAACKTATPTTTAAETTAAETTAAATETTAAATSASEPTKKFRIALSNPIVDNAWGQSFMKIVDYVAKDPKYSDRADFKIYTSEYSAEAQAAQIDGLILEDYDAILIAAASATGLNEAIKRADEKGIIVVTVSQIAQSENAWQTRDNYEEVAMSNAKFIAEKLGGKGKIFVDRGLPGVEGANPLYDGALAVFDTYPGIEVVFTFDSMYTEGDTLAGMQAGLASNPQVDGVYSQGYISPIIKALKEAGRPPVVIAGYSYNGGMLDILNNPGYEAIVTHESPGASAFGLKMALDLLEGTKDWPKGEVIYIPTVYWATDTTVNAGVKLEKLEMGVNVFEDVPPGFMMPTVQPEVGVTVPNEAVLVPDIS
ncbi:MAG: substrate-binding domain-containing protein [Actinobacteria bacterium]|nr:substrate-binding domain-containing protein [Actinomycetota bacterium]